MGRIQNYLALEETIIVEIVETVVETSLEEAVAVVDITLGASAPPKHSTAMERFKETAEGRTISSKLNEKIASYTEVAKGNNFLVRGFKSKRLKL